MKQVKVVGIGSPFGEDQIGCQVAELLQQSELLQQYIPTLLEIKLCDRPGAQLLELMQGADTVYLIDAIKSGTSIGTIHRLKDNAIDNNQNLLSSHDFGVAATLKLGRALNDLPKNIILYGIEIGDELTQTIKQEVSEAKLKLAKQLETELQTLL